MFRLLTEEESKKVMREYSTRRSAVIIAALTCVLAVAIVGLLPSYILSDARHKEVSGRAGAIDERMKADADEAALWLARTNRALRILSPALDTDRPSTFIDDVLVEQGTGIRITGFSWTRVEDGISLKVDGIASTRQDLSVFEGRVSNSEHFVNVTLPISDLARDRDIDFTLSFLLAP